MFGEYLRGQRTERLADNRWDCVSVDQDATQSGDFRTHIPG